MNTKIILLGILYFFSLSSAFAVSKEKMDYDFVYCTGRMKADISQEYKSCLTEAQSLFYSAENAHKLFLEDRPLDAALKYMDVLEEAARKQINGGSRCPYSVFTRCEFNYRYMQYFLEHKETPDTKYEVKRNDSSPSDDDLRVLIAKVAYIHNTMAEVCSKHKCNKAELLLIKHSKELYYSIQENKIRSHDIMYLLLCIKIDLSNSHWLGNVGDDLPFYPVFYKINQEINPLISRMKGNVLNGDDPLFNDYRLKIIDDMLMETEYDSRSPEMLYHYYAAMNIPRYGRLDQDLLNYIERDKVIFENLIYYLSTTPRGKITHAQVLHYGLYYSKTVKSLMLKYKNNSESR